MTRRESGGRPPHSGFHPKLYLHVAGPVPRLRLGCLESPGAEGPPDEDPAPTDGLAVCAGGPSDYLPRPQSSRNPGSVNTAPVRAEATPGAKTVVAFAGRACMTAHSEIARNGWLRQVSPLASRRLGDACFRIEPRPPRRRAGPEVRAEGLSARTDRS
jgi:hypothetical protein